MTVTTLLRQAECAGSQVWIEPDQDGFRVCWFTSEGVGGVDPYDRSVSYLTALYMAARIARERAATPRDLPVRQVMGARHG